jgi:hypothetical protein
MTDLLNYFKGAANIKTFKETKNYYYDNHNCPSQGNNIIKIRLDYMLSSDLDDAVLRVGICEKCGLCLYHKDFQSKSSF